MRKRVFLYLLSFLLVLTVCLNVCNNVYASNQKTYVIVLDPGHGGADSGAYRTYDGTIVNEKDLNLKIAQACKRELETYKNVTVYMTRNSDRCLYSTNAVEELQARADYADGVGADLYVSLHINAGSGNSRGALVLTPVSTENSYGHSFHDEMEELAGDILRKLQALGLTNRGTLARYYDVDDNRDYYAVIRHSKEYDIPAIIVEHAFLDNSDDYYSFLSTDSELADLGKADAAGIAQYLGLSKGVSIDEQLTDFSNQWKWLDGAWYHFNASGYPQTGWQYIDGNWYYLAGDGAMRTGWQYIKGSWYYLNGSGAMATGWINTNGHWYYLDSSGAMKTGWQRVDGTWYYLKGSGSMAYNEYEGGYWLNRDGSWTYPYTASWKMTDGKWWYGDDSGWYARNQSLRIDGKAYSFDIKGYLK